MFENLKRDLHRAMLGNQGGEVGAVPLLRELFNPGTQAIVIYRMGRWTNGLSKPLRIPLRAVHFILQYFFAWRVGIFIPLHADIGPGMIIHNWGGGIVLPSARIGRDLTIIGGGVLMDFDTREIGDEVRIGAGTKVVGKVRLGHRVKTAPNSVIHLDVPDDMVAYGNPARFIRAVVRSKPLIPSLPLASKT